MHPGNWISTTTYTLSKPLFVEKKTQIKLVGRKIKLSVKYVNISDPVKMPEMYGRILPCSTMRPCVQPRES